MKLVVFLGNPGEKYAKTRHNVGFLFADFLQEAWNLSHFVMQKKWNAEWVKEAFYPPSDKGGRARIEDRENLGGKRDVIFLKPQTFMNLSGHSVQKAAHFFAIPKEDILVCYDDADQLLGSWKYKVKGGAGGQKGMQSIIELLGSKELQRLKIGIRKEHDDKAGEFVLKPFSGEDLETLEKQIFPELEERLRGLLNITVSRGVTESKL